MKIVLIGTVSSSIFGFRKLLLNSLVSQGYDVYILTTDLTPELQVRAKAELNVTAIQYSLARTGLNPLVDIKTMLALVKILKKISPDIVFSYFSKPIIWGTLACKLAGVKRCYGMIEGLGYFFTVNPHRITLKKSLLRTIQVLLFKISIPKLTGLIFLNPDDQNEIINKYNIRVKKSTVLGGIGLDLEEYRFRKKVPEGLSFIFIGRLLVEKGVNEFLNAAEVIHNKYPDVKFNILGRLDIGNPGAVNTKRLEQLKKDNIIIHPGAVLNVTEWLESSSVFVLPSYREGVPRSTQEAMSVGLPIITTDVPGCRETIHDGVNGFLIPPQNSDALAIAMEKFILNKELIASMGVESRIMAENKFNAIEINHKLMSFLDLV